MVCVALFHAKAQRGAKVLRRDVIVWRLENGVATILYMVLDFKIMATRNSEVCFVCDGLRGETP